MRNRAALRDFPATRRLTVPGDSGSPVAKTAAPARPVFPRAARDCDRPSCGSPPPGARPSPRRPSVRAEGMSRRCCGRHLGVRVRVVPRRPALEPIPAIRPWAWSCSRRSAGAHAHEAGKRRHCVLPRPAAAARPCPSETEGRRPLCGFEPGRPSAVSGRAVVPEGGPPATPPRVRTRVEALARSRPAGRPARLPRRTCATSAYSGAPPSPTIDRKRENTMEKSRERLVLRKTGRYFAQKSVHFESFHARQGPGRASQNACGRIRKDVLRRFRRARAVRICRRSAARAWRTGRLIRFADCTAEPHPT